MAAQRPPAAQPPKPGERIVQRELADLLRRIARQGAAGLHAGEVADAIDSWMRANGGLLTRQDLADYQPIFGEPLRQQFRDDNIACVATPSGASPAWRSSASSIAWIAVRRRTIPRHICIR